MAVLERLVRQRRFKLALAVLVAIALMKGLLVVRFESQVPGAKIHTWFDGIWWAVTTVTGVGYGDTVPVSVPGRVVGMMLEVVGVLIFGMIVGMMTTAMYEERDAFYRRRLHERLDSMDEKLGRIEKQGGFVVRQESKKL